MQFERNYNLINSKFWQFFFPTIFSVLVGNMAIFVDSLIVSKLIGVVALSGMQIISPLSCFVNLSCWMIGLGGSLLCASAKASFNEKKANGLFSVSLGSIVLIAIILAVIGSLFPDIIIQYLSNSSQPNVYALDYFKMYILGIPFLCYLICMFYFVRTDGMAKFTFNALVISSLLNPIFDVILIYYFNMGMAGSGLATTIGYIGGALYMSTYFFKSNRTLKLIKVRISAAIRCFFNVCKSGFAGASEQLYMTITTLLFNSLIISYLGNEGLFSQQICNNTLIIMSIFIIGLIQTISPIISVYYQDGDYSAVNYLKNLCFKLIIGVGLAFTLFLLLFPQIVAQLYSVTSGSMEVVTNALRLYGLRYLFIGFIDFYIFYAQCIQKNKMANMASLLSNFVLVILVLYASTFAIGSDGIWLTYFIVGLVSMLIFVAYSKYLNRKTDGEYEGVFINKSHKDNFWEFTIDGNIGEANELSALVKDTLKDNTLAEYASQSLKEYLTNVIETNEEVKTIDVLLEDDGDSIKISIKDSGIERNEEFAFENEIEGCNRKVNYSQVLGLNSTLITLE